MSRLGRRLARLFRLVVLVALASAPATNVGADPRVERFALLIQNDRYPDAEPAKGPDDDATTLAATLKAAGFDVVLEKNVTRQAMRASLEALLARVTPGSTALVYYKGIGIQVSRLNYLIPVDALIWSDEDVRRQGTNLDALMSDLNRRGAGVKIAVLDAARPNPFERRFRMFSAGLGSANAPDGSLVIFAEALNRVAEPGPGPVSPFMTELTRQLATTSDAESAFARTRESVAKTTKGRELPWVSSTLVAPLALGPATAATQAPAAPPKPPGPNPSETASANPPPADQGKPPAPAPAPAPALSPAPAKPEIATATPPAATPKPDAEPGKPPAASAAAPSPDAKPDQAKPDQSKPPQVAPKPESPKPPEPVPPPPAKPPETAPANPPAPPVAAPPKPETPTGKPAPGAKPGAGPDQTKPSAAPPKPSPPASSSAPPPAPAPHDVTAPPKPAAPSSAGTAPAPPAPPPAALRPGSTFSDCPRCPEMTVLAAASFQMGSGTTPFDRPVHKVTLAKPFAIALSVVTRDEWALCVADGACTPNSDKTASDGATFPTVDVSWSDAQRYVAFLSKKTGKTYRLPTEAEWEYAARGGTATAFAWGDSVGVGQANCSDCGTPHAAPELEPVRRYPKNGFGLFDMAGNAAQWLQDCWTLTYWNARADGSAPPVENCKMRVVRGGSFATSSAYIKPTARFAASPATRSRSNGFRVARDLP